MRTLLLLFIAICSIACNHMQIQMENTETSFVPEMENVPICTGFYQDHTQTAFFDSPQGRIISVVLVGRDKAGYVETFYEDTLEVLGWQVGTDGMFYRNGEQLRVRVNDQGTMVQLQLEPFQ